MGEGRQHKFREVAPVKRGGGGRGPREEEEASLTSWLWSGMWYVVAVDVDFGFKDVEEEDKEEENGKETGQRASSWDGLDKI